jgi:GDPmannose 4,6-dehydratase
MRALICGVSGQDGAYLARCLLGRGYEVYGTSRDAEVRSFANLARLGIAGQVATQSMASNDFRSVLQVLSRVDPDEIYSLAGQSSVGLSFEQPVETLESISMGTLNLLEAMRFLGKPMRLYSAGSGECYGDTGGARATEDTPFRPRSPYAVAKATAHWLVANYREAYGLHASTGILFNHESPLRSRRFVTRKIVAAACAIAGGSRERLTLGNVEIHRDWGWAPEYVEAMWRMLQQPGALAGQLRRRGFPALRAQLAGSRRQLARVVPPRRYCLQLRRCGQSRERAGLAAAMGNAAGGAGHDRGGAGRWPRGDLTPCGSGRA